jgi:hypothetical protein
MASAAARDTTRWTVADADSAKTSGKDMRTSEYPKVKRQGRSCRGKRVRAQRYFDNLMLTLHASDYRYTPQQ